MGRRSGGDRATTERSKLLSVSTIRSLQEATGGDHLMLQGQSGGGGK